MSKPASVPRIRRAPIAKLAAGRLLSDFLPLLSGEQALLLACRQGDVAELGASVPEEPVDTLHIRAAFLRFLMLGGDRQAPVHERGVQLAGAYVVGRLDLAGCRIPHNVSLKRCRFSGLVFAQDARVDGLMTLQGSHLSLGLNADRLRCEGGLFLRGGFKATGAVRLLGAQIGGDLACGGGQFVVEEGEALSADRAVVKGGAFFNDGFKATGEVRLLGAQIGGNLACGGGQFEVKGGKALSADRAVVQGSVFFNSGFKATGEVRLLGAQIDGSLDCGSGQFEAKNAYALLLERAVVRGGWHFTKQKAPVCVNAGHMEVAVLADAIDSWAAGSVLDGLRYGALGGSAPTQGKARLDWLQKQQAGHLGERDDSDDFRPQPWRHLQHVLREMGHAEDARQIGIAFERRLRRIGRIGQSPKGRWVPAARLKRWIAEGGHALFGWLSGYGYRPLLLLLWMFLVWLICGLSYWWLATPPHNAIGPSDPLVFQHERYAACASESPVTTSAAAGGALHARNWYLCADLPAEYATFSPWAYSLDLLLPFVDLGQDKAWGALVPTPKGNPLEELLAFSPGHRVRWLVWFQTLFGWVASLLLVGIASGFARRSEE